MGTDGAVGPHRGALRSLPNVPAGTAGQGAMATAAGSAFAVTGPQTDGEDRGAGEAGHLGYAVARCPCASSGGVGAGSGVPGLHWYGDETDFLFRDFTIVKLVGGWVGWEISQAQISQPLHLTSADVNIPQTQACAGEPIVTNTSLKLNIVGIDYGFAGIP